MDTGLAYGVSEYSTVTCISGPQSHKYKDHINTIVKLSCPFPGAHRAFQTTVATVTYTEDDTLQCVLGSADQSSADL